MNKARLKVSATAAAATGVCGTDTLTASSTITTCLQLATTMYIDPVKRTSSCSVKCSVNGVY
jgi:hypothetical protein